MNRILASSLLSGLAAITASGQSTTSPVFDVADVHVSAKFISPVPAVNGVRTLRGGGLRGSRYALSNVTIVDLIGIAYGVDNDKVVGGPSWLEIDQFDIIAKAPANATEAMVKPMLQHLLADRFKLAVHNDSRPFSVFVLSMGKGKPKLKEAGTSATAACDQQRPAADAVTNMKVSCHNLTMAAFAEQLPRIAGAYLPSQVLDRTDFKGSWDFEFSYTGRARLADAGAGISIFDSVDKQLGLKLDQQKLPLPVVVVDSVNQKPTPNAPGVTTRIPPAPPAEFEVGEVKPTGPNPQGQSIQFQPGGRFDATNMPLKTLIILAWNISPDELVDAPKWLDTARWDVVAKAPTTPGVQIDQDDIRLMLRALLADRFKLKTHFEDRPMTAYTLLAGKPKLTKADPSNRAKCQVGQATGRDVTLGSMRAITCQNVTMAQFADQLPNLGSRYIRGPATVIDSTGIEGAFDFVVTFSPVGADGAAGGGGRSAGGAPTAVRQQQDPGALADPSGAVSLFDALSKQLGLKLEMQKRPLPVLVIDHIEEKPTEN